MNPKVIQNPSPQAPFNYDSLTIRLADRRDAPAVEELRKTAYERSRSISIRDLSILNWDRSHERHPVLVVENEQGELVSTMRGVWIETPEELQKFSNFIPPRTISYPLLLLKAGCTRFEYRGLGLNTLQKMELIKHLVGSEVTCVVNEINRGSRRIARMESMGFDRFFDVNLKRSYGSSDPMAFRSPLAVGILPRERFSHFIYAGKEELVNAFKTLHRVVGDASRFSTYFKQRELAASPHNGVVGPAHRKPANSHLRFQPASPFFAVRS